MLIELTAFEIELIKSGLWAQISDYCCSRAEEKPYRDLLGKLDVMGCDEC